MLHQQLLLEHNVYVYVHVLSQLHAMQPMTSQISTFKAHIPTIRHLQPMQPTTHKTRAQHKVPGHELTPQEAHIPTDHGKMPKNPWSGTYKQPTPQGISNKRTRACAQAHSLYAAHTPSDQHIRSNVCSSICKYVVIFTICSLHIE